MLPNNDGVDDLHPSTLKTMRKISLLNQSVASTIDAISRSEGGHLSRSERARRVRAANNERRHTNNLSKSERGPSLRSRKASNNKQNKKIEEEKVEESYSKALPAIYDFDDPEDLPYEGNIGTSMNGSVLVLHERRMTTLETVPIILKSSEVEDASMCARIFSHPLFDIIRCMDGIAPYFLSEEQHISVQVLDGIARSFGQVVFCNNPFSGIIILIAMLLADWHAGLCALLCNIVTNCLAALLGVDSTLILHGLLGYNAVLVGAGVSVFLSFESDIAPFVVAMFGAGAVLIAHLFTARVLAHYGAAALTFPFNGVMMMILLSAQSWKSTSRAALTVDESIVDEFLAYDAIFKGISEIYILDDAKAGILILCGMALSSRILALCAFCGSLFGALGTWAFFDVPMSSINLGLCGYNAALTCPALLFFIVPSTSSIFLSMFGIFLTLGSQTAIANIVGVWDLPSMTLPFCLATLPFVGIDTDAICSQNFAHIKIIALTDLTTPTEHYRRFGRKKQRHYDDETDDAFNGNL